MKTILVSGASGIVGYGILKSLKLCATPVSSIGTTIYQDSAAQGFCDRFELAPRTDDEGYMAWLLAVIRRHAVDLLIPGIEIDVYTWNEHAADIERTGCRIVLNTPALTALCRDKWHFYEALKTHASPYAIDTTLHADFDALAQRFGLPFLVKPRRGFGSRGIVRIADAAAFSACRAGIGATLMVQPIVGSDDEEFTTSAFCDGSGGYYARMTLKRTLSTEGFTDKAEVVDMADIDTAIADLCRIFKPVGPTNFQFRKRAGALKLLEINPRISSSTSIRTAFGYNEAQMAVGYYLENTLPVQPPIRRGRAVRYTEDLVFYEDRTDL